jgi:hypothetical protein
MITVERGPQKLNRTALKLCHPLRRFWNTQRRRIPPAPSDLENAYAKQAFAVSVRHTAIVIGFLMLGLSGPANAQCTGFPHYPPESKAANEQGTVTVSVHCVRPQGPGVMVGGCVAASSIITQIRLPVGS